MKKNNFSIYFIFIAFFSFIAIFTSIVQNSYQNLIKPVNQVKDEKITNIDTKLDMDVISQIESRQEISTDSSIMITNPVPATSSVSFSPVSTKSAVSPVKIILVP